MTRQRILTLGTLIFAIPFLAFALAILWRTQDTTNTLALANVEGGDASQGPNAIKQYGCGACHTIPGIDGAQGKVGPPLAGIGNRSFVAGVVPNTPDNLVAWIRNPQAIDPLTDMPMLGVSETAARDIAAYLYTLNDD